MTERESWPGALDSLSDSLGVAGCLFVSRQADVTVPHSPIPNDLQGLIGAYFSEGWCRHDETSERGWPIIESVKTVITDDDISTPEERMRSPYYQDFRIKHGFPHWAAISCCSGGEARALALLRNGRQGEFTPAEIGQFAQLSKHLSRIFTLAAAVGSAQITTCLDMLERISQPACLLGRTGDVISMNSRAEALLDGDLFLRRGRLTAAHEQSRVRLEAVLDYASLARVDSSLGDVPDTVRIERGRRRPLVLQAIPLSGRLPGVFSPAVAILLINDLEKISEPTRRLLRQVWNLSNAEARVASELCGGKSLEDAAVELRISKETARKHLTAIFGKVGTRRQAELVALLKSVPKIDV